MITKDEVTDVPNIEGDVIVAGYLLVRAKSLQEAVDMARKCPNLIYGLNVEVRNVMPIEYDVKSGSFLDLKS